MNLCLLMIICVAGARSSISIDVDSVSGIIFIVLVLCSFFCSRRIASNGSRRVRYVVVVSQSNRTHIVISITSVVVECVVVSSYRSRIVVESQ